MLVSTLTTALRFLHRAEVDKKSPMSEPKLLINAQLCIKSASSSLGFISGLSNQNGLRVEDKFSKFYATHIIF